MSIIKGAFLFLQKGVKDMRMENWLLVVNWYWLHVASPQCAIL